LACSSQLEEKPPEENHIRQPSSALREWIGNVSRDTKTSDSLLLDTFIGPTKPILRHFPQNRYKLTDSETAQVLG